jgi:hypothetical protein
MPAIVVALIVLLVAMVVVLFFVYRRRVSVAANSDLSDFNEEENCLTLEELIQMDIAAVEILVEEFGEENPHYVRCLDRLQKLLTDLTSGRISEAEAELQYAPQEWFDSTK